MSDSDDLATAYERFVKPGADLLCDIGFPVTPGLRTAVLAVGWAERNYRTRAAYRGESGFWAITCRAVDSVLRGMPSPQRAALIRVCDCLVMPNRKAATIRAACQWNDDIAVATTVAALYPALPRQPSEPWLDLNAARKLAWGGEREPVTQALWYASARIAAA